MQKRQAGEWNRQPFDFQLKLNRAVASLIPDLVLFAFFWFWTFRNQRDAGSIPVILSDSCIGQLSTTQSKETCLCVFSRDTTSKLSTLVSTQPQRCWESSIMIRGAVNAKYLKFLVWPEKGIEPRLYRFRGRRSVQCALDNQLIYGYQHYLCYW